MTAAHRHGGRRAGHDLHQLWFGGEWTCVEYSVETLGPVARRLATRAPGPLRRQLAAFARVCRTDPDHAYAAWLRLKQQMLGPRLRAHTPWPRNP